MTGSYRVASFYRRLFGPAEGQDEREFLPAALEVIQTPASPTGRALIVIIVLMFVVAAGWSFLGRVDVIATAPGRLLPAGDIKTIQSLDPGVVRAIHVQDGDHVSAGQILVELDPTLTDADRDRLSKDLALARLDSARLRALKTAIATGGAPRFTPPPGAPPEYVAQTIAAMYAQADQAAAKAADLTQQISQKAAELGEIEAVIEKTRAAIPLLAEKERIHRDLTAQGYGTSLSYLDAQQQLSDARHDLAVQAQRISQTQDARAALERQRDGARSQYAAETLDELRKAEDRENELTQELVKAQDKVSETGLRSPIDGVVQQLALHTLHGVVTPAQALMIVVPDTGTLVVEAHLANRDVGFVHAGQAVKIKVETFNFTRYGLIDGRVIDVSRDAFTSTDDRARAGAPPQAEANTPEANPASPTYIARIALSRTSIMVDGRQEPLQPGMSITAEIKTGNRTIIDYLLSPIARRAQESLHER